MEKKIIIKEEDKEIIKNMCEMVLINAKNFFKEMEIKVKNKHKLSLLEEQLIAEYTLAYLQVIAIKRSI